MKVGLLPYKYLSYVRNGAYIVFTNIPYADPLLVFAPIPYQVRFMTKSLLIQNVYLRDMLPKYSKFHES